jgi:phosphatidate cytidylyltransferase
MFSTPHQKRLITGLALVVPLLACLYAGGWPLRILVCLAALLALWEFFQMFWPGWSNLALKGAGLAGGAAITIGTGLLFDADGVLAVMGLAALFSALHFTLRYSRGEADPAKSLLLIFGLVYIPLTLQCALRMDFAGQGMALLGAVASDVGAYYAGSRFGRHKVCPKVSPNKSWEGVAGGITATALIITIFGVLAAPPGLEGLRIWQWPVVGACFSLTAQFGDFFESALKRSAGVKDSSNLLPGHGGVLDRLDSIALTIPAAYILLSLI